MNILQAIDAALPARARSIIKTAGELAAEQGFRAYLVGGTVRDILLRRTNLDLDIMVEGGAGDYAGRLAEMLGGSVVLHDRFGTSVIILDDGARVDIAVARTETYDFGGALPTVSFSTISRDLKRRDFTVNAIAASIMPGEKGSVFDPYGGIDDIRKKKLRVLHEKSFLDDPTRIFRAARFEQRLGFKMSSRTESLLREAAESGSLAPVSGARIRKEVFAILEEPGAAEAAARLEEFGVWQALAKGLSVKVPTVKAIRDVHKAEGALLHKLKAPYDRRFAILNVICAGTDSSAAHDLCARLGINRKRAAEAVALAGMIDEAMSFLRQPKTAGALWELLHDRSNETLCCLYALGNEAVRASLVRFSQMSGIRPLISGRDLKKAGYPPGAGYSTVLEAVYRRQLDGELSVKEQAMTAAMRLFKEQGYGHR